MKRILSLILIIMVVISLVPPVTGNAVSYTYNPDAAISYAKAHYNDGKGLCAEFVSDCLKAGGFTAVYNVNARNLGRQLQGYGTKITCSGWSSSSCLKASMFNGTLSKGDVIVWENVSGSSNSGHVMLYSGKTNSNGQILVYAHNSAKNEDVIKPSASASTVYAIHLTSTNENNNTYYFDFNANGGTLGSSGAFSVSYGEQFQVLNTTCTRSGYTWAGWNVKRNNDNKWYVDGQGWRTESEIISNGYVRKVYPNYKTLTLDNSWIGGLSGDGSYTFYAVWYQSRETMFYAFMSPYGKDYDHLTAYNNKTDTGVARERIYLWYILYDKHTGDLLNTYADWDYSVYMEIYDPLGELVYDWNYTNSSDANWISVVPDMSGIYTAVATFTRGDTVVQSNVATYEVVYDAELISSVSSVSLNLNETNSQTITISVGGGLPGSYNVRRALSNSNVSTSWGSWNGRTIPLTITGNKVGQTDVIVEIFECYTGNDEMVSRIVIPVTVTVNTYTIKYNANGGSEAPSDQIKYHGTDITLSSTIPTRNGYTFLGWSTSSTATSATYQPGGTFSLDANTTLYAVWKAKATALSVNSTNSAYISTGGEMKYYTFTPSTSYTNVIYSTGSDDTRVYLYDASGNELANNDDGGENRNFRLEYNFTAGMKYTFGVKYYDSSKTGTISFKFGNVYTISYDANGGTGAPSSQKKDYGANITFSSTIPTRTGYTFEGWASFSSATSSAYQPGATYTSDIDTTLYAVWSKIPTYTISYNANGGSGTPADQTKTKDVNLTLSSTVPTRTGYTFLGWSASSTATSASYQAGSSFTTNANTTLYAVWKQKEYTVSYNANGGNGAPSNQIKYHGTPLTLSSTVPAKDGHIFQGWSTSSTATSASYQAGSSFTTDANTTLYAVWEEDSATLSLNSTNSATISAGGEVKYYTYSPSISGTYVIYSTGDIDTKVYLYDANGTQLSSNDDGGNNRNFRLVYNMTAGTTYKFGVQYYSSSTTGTISFVFGEVYTVTFTLNNGSMTTPTQCVDYGRPLVLDSTAPTRTGCTFLGWSTSSTANVVSYQLGDSVTVTGNMNLYAVWEANSLTISYDANGGTGAPSPTVFVYGQSAVLSDVIPRREGYTFLGWSTSSTATTASHQPGSAFVTNANYTLYAVWRANTYTVRYNSNGGSGSMSNSTHTYNVSKALSSNGYSRSGYTFLGWATSSSATSASYTNGQSVMNLTYIDGAIVDLYAVWSKIPTYTISYNANGGSGAPADQVKTQDVNLTLSSVVPTREGYTFLGWSINSTATSATHQASDTFTTNADTTLYAVWEAVVPAVLLGDVNADGVVDAGDAVLISRYDAGFIALTPEQLKAGDVNKDGTVDAGDAVLISRYDAGFIPSLN